MQADNWAVIRRLLRLLRPFLGWTALSIALGALTIASSVGLMGTAAYLISAAALHPSVADLQVAIVGVRFFGLSRGVLRYLERLVSHSVNFRLLAALRSWFYRRIEPLAPARLLDERSGDLLTLAVADIDTLENFYVRVVAPVLAAGVVLAGMFIWLQSYSRDLALALLAFLLAAGLGLPWVSHRVGEASAQRLVTQRAALQSHLLDSLQGMADVVAFGQQAPRMEQARALGAALAATQRAMAWITGGHTAVGGLLANLGMWTVLALAIPLVQQGRMDGVSLAVVALGSLASFEAVTPLALAAQYLGASLTAARRLFGLADRTPAVVDPAQPQPSPQGNGIMVRGLSFSYGDAEHDILQDLDFDLGPGEHKALVGPSGSGKSTLVTLLLRFYDYQHGQVTLGGVDLRHLRQEDVRRRISVISQSTYLFDATLRQNLLLANPQAPPEALDRACREAQLDAFILGLPDGYETWVGEHGLRLSGGERQRLAIARALLREAPIWVLDEPTAHLDPLTEQRFMQVLTHTMRGRSLLLITHTPGRVGADG